MDVDALTMNQESLAEMLFPGKWINPFPKYKYTERPDTAAASMLEIAATKISAGVSTGIGSHAKGLEDQGDEQFEISDGRTVKQVYDALLEEGLQPVMSDYIYV